MSTTGLRNGRRWTETCSVDGCGSPFYCKGLCGRHYARLRKYGDPSICWPTKRTGCMVEGCHRQHHAHGLCGSHQSRRASGDLRADVSDRITGRPPKGDAAGYDAAHRRLSRLLGPASDRACVDCGKPAAEWSYAGGDPDELTTQPDIRSEHPGLVYSLDPAYYEARCVRCHRMADHSLDHSSHRDERGRFAPAASRGEPPGALITVSQLF